MTGHSKTLPSKEDLPREKLHRLGRSSLSNKELLAIFLRTGTHGKNVMELAAELIDGAGSLEVLAKLDAFEISGLSKGIGKAKSAALAAAFELGCRAIREEVVRRTLDQPSHVYDLLITEMRWLNQESACVLLVDTKLKLIRKLEISIGTLNETIIHPRDILRPAIIHNAYGFILAHNHPSGAASPSKADDSSTRRVAEAASLIGIRFVDHIIIGKPDIAGGNQPFFSYRENKRIIES